MSNFCVFTIEGRARENADGGPCASAGGTEAFGWTCAPGPVLVTGADGGHAPMRTRICEDQCRASVARPNASDTHPHLPPLLPQLLAICPDQTLTREV